MTKYDCSSADVNPIGGISKAALKPNPNRSPHPHPNPNPTPHPHTHPSPNPNPNPNPMPKQADLKRFLVHAATHLGYPSLRAVVEAPPTAELRPLKGGEIEQTDEEDMGMSYDELGIFGRLRKVPHPYGHPYAHWADSAHSACRAHLLHNLPLARSTTAAPSQCSKSFSAGGRAAAPPPRSPPRCKPFQPTTHLPAY
jgi:NH3-dependent NAD+ synthetase